MIASKDIAKYAFDKLAPDAQERCNLKSVTLIVKNLHSYIIEWDVLNDDGNIDVEKFSCKNLRELVDEKGLTLDKKVTNKDILCIVELYNQLLNK